MAIVQQNPGKPNEAISVDPANTARIIVQPFPFGGSETIRQEFDLTAFQGGPFRLYLERDGSFSTELYGDHYWLLVEAMLPERQYDSVPTSHADEYGNPKTELVERALDLNDIDIIVFPLPEVV